MPIKKCIMTIFSVPRASIAYINFIHKINIILYKGQVPNLPPSPRPYIETDGLGIEMGGFGTCPYIIGNYSSI